MNKETAKLLFSHLEKLGCPIVFPEEVEKTLKDEGYEPYESGDNDPVHCIDCKHLMFSDCYGECGAAHKGIVQPNDTCPWGERRNNDAV